MRISQTSAPLAVLAAALALSACVSKDDTEQLPRYPSSPDPSLPQTSLLELQRKAVTGADYCFIDIVKGLMGTINTSAIKIDRNNTQYAQDKCERQTGTFISERLTGPIRITIAPESLPIQPTPAPSNSADGDFIARFAPRTKADYCLKNRINQEFLQMAEGKRPGIGLKMTIDAESIAALTNTCQAQTNSVAEGYRMQLMGDDLIVVLPPHI